MGPKSTENGLTRKSGSRRVYAYPEQQELSSLSINACVAVICISLQQQVGAFWCDGIVLVFPHVLHL